MIADRDGHRSTQARVLSGQARAERAARCNANAEHQAMRRYEARSQVQNDGRKRMPRRRGAGEAPSLQEGTLQFIRLVCCGRQAAFAFATWVAIASMRAGDRQS